MSLAKRRTRPGALPATCRRGRTARIPPARKTASDRNGSLIIRQVLYEVIDERREAPNATRVAPRLVQAGADLRDPPGKEDRFDGDEIGRASCRERG